jgi:HK97 family phage prohead protease
MPAVSTITRSGLRLEVRRAAPFEVRETRGSLRLTGYASVTDAPYEVGFFTEVIRRGAFTTTLASNPDVQLLIGHQGLPLARTRSGNLRLTEDDRGLRVDADLDPTDPDVARLAPKAARGDVDEMSFAFRVVDQLWNDDYDHRTILAVDIDRGDVSVVARGANGATTFALRRAGSRAAGSRSGGPLDLYVARARALKLHGARR